MQITNNARLHRFGEFIAVWFGKPHETVYLSPELARQLAETLSRYVRDIEENPTQVGSTVGTANLMGRVDWVED